MYRYQEVVEKIKSLIVNEKDLHKLPDERSLAEHFSVSRATIRKALALLKKENIVDIRHGAGIFVNDNTLVQSIEFGSLTQDMEFIGKDVTTDVLDCTIINTPVSGDLSEFSSDKIIRLERIRNIGGVKSIQELNYLCAERLPGLEHKIADYQSLYELLSNEYQVEFDQGFEKLSAGFILQDTAAKLNTSAMNCAVKVIRSTYEKKRLVEYTISYWLAENYSWQYELKNLSKLYK